MSWEEYDENCEGCRPGLIDARTGLRLPDDSPEMIAILSVWAQTTLIQRQAWHRVTCQGSTDGWDRFLIQPFVKAMHEALKAIHSSSP